MNKPRLVNALGEDPVLGILPEGQGGYVAAPYHHPWTGNLVRVPPGLLNPMFDGSYGSYKLGFQGGEMGSRTTRGVFAPNYAPLIAFANGYELQGQMTLQPLADFASSKPSEE